jgi:hypothetical protein
LRRLALVALVATIWWPAAAAAQVTDDIDALIRQVADVRGLSPRARVVPILASVSEIRANSIAWLDRDLAGAEASARVQALRLMGLDTLGWEPASLGSIELTRDVNAFYSGDTGRLQVSSDLRSLRPIDKLMLAHEAVHAIQDQYFNISRFRVGGGQGVDAVLAARAVVEGDAMLATVAWGQQYLNSREKFALGVSQAAREPLLPNASAFAQARFQFLHGDGVRFVQAIKRARRVPNIDLVLFDPPRSTEQVLHPEKYIAGESPISVILSISADGLGGAWSSVGLGTFGELDLRLALRESLDIESADRAAAGWGGDTFAVFRHSGGSYLLVSLSAWDTDADAAEYFNAIGQMVTTKHGRSATKIADRPSSTRWRTPSGVIHTLKTGPRVLTVIGPEPTVIDLVIAQFSGVAPTPTPTTSNGADLPLAPNLFPTTSPLTPIRETPAPIVDEEEDE